MSLQGGSVLVWTNISIETRTNLIFIENDALSTDKYVENIQQEAVVLVSAFFDDDFVLTHNNDKPHMTRVVPEYLNEIVARKLDRPTCSPDLNPLG